MNDAANRIALDGAARSNLVCRRFGLLRTGAAARLAHAIQSAARPPGNAGSQDESRQRRLVWLFQVLLLLALWVALHPYMGIVHDARLYLAQALNSLHHNLDRDLYFAYGSQDSFTVFSLIYRYIVAAAGYSAAHMAVTAIGQAAWFAAMLYLTRSIFGPGWQAVAACAGIILLYPHYDGAHVFRYGEAFATPRLFAEALVLIAIGSFQRGRMWLTGLCLIAAGALHPLMALPGMAVVALLAAARHKRLWLLYAAAPIAALVLAAIGIEPFARLLARFDEQWFDVVYQRCHFAFITRWQLYFALGPLSHAAVLAVAWRLAEPPERRLIAAVGTVAAGGVVLTLLGADFLRNVLITNVQPWRGLWLLALLANAWAVIVACRLPPGWVCREMIVCALIGQAAVMAVGVAVPFPSVLFIVGTLFFFWETWRRERLPPALRVAARLIAVSLMMLGGIAIYKAIPLRPELTELSNIYKYAAGFAIATIAVAVLSVWIRRPNRPATVHMLLVAALVLAAFLAIDRRDSWARFLHRPELPASLAVLVAEAPNLYWEAEPTLAWLKLDRPGYYSCLHGAGAMFFRSTALEFRRRTDGLSALNTADFLKEKNSRCPPKENPDQDGPHSPEQLAAACRALPDLDAMVLTTLVPDAPHTVWEAPVHKAVERRDESGRKKLELTNRFFLYRCADLR